MIYIKDYQALDQYLHPDPADSLKDRLSELIGRPVRVYVDSGGVSGQGFTGILIEVYSDSIKLITKLPSAPTLHEARTSKQKQADEFGTYTIIPLSHVVAVDYQQA